jgi:hypothetical protein
MLAFPLAGPMRILVDYDFDGLALGFHQGSLIGNSAVARRAEVKDVLRRARMETRVSSGLGTQTIFLVFLGFEDHSHASASIARHLESAPTLIGIVWIRSMG